MNQQETEALATELAGTKCPACHANCDNDSAVCGLCETCHGTGFLFPASVRVLCSCLTKAGCSACANPIRFQHGSWCLVCAGRGWTASLDFVTWCWALKAVGAPTVDINLEQGTVKLYGYAVGGNEWWADKAERLLTALMAEEQA